MEYKNNDSSTGRESEAAGAAIKPGWPVIFFNLCRRSFFSTVAVCYLVLITFGFFGDISGWDYSRITPAIILALVALYRLASVLTEEGPAVMAELELAALFTLALEIMLQAAPIPSVAVFPSLPPGGDVLHPLLEQDSYCTLNGPAQGPLA